MANKVARKTFKVEFELTVEMDELEQCHIQQAEPADQLAHLKRLQQALLEDEAALNRQMLAAVIAKLQDYLDRMASQDSLASLAKSAGGLQPGDCQFFKEYAGEFITLTQPLRLASISARLNHSAVQEWTGEEGGDASWRCVWSDLLLETSLGRELQKLNLIPDPSANRPVPSGRHYLLARHLTRQLDGVHFEARCSCDRFLEGVGEDEDHALSALWEAHERHRAAFTGSHEDLQRRPKDFGEKS